MVQCDDEFSAEANEYFANELNVFAKCKDRGRTRFKAELL